MERALTLVPSPLDPDDVTKFPDKNGPTQAVRRPITPVSDTPRCTTHEKNTLLSRAAGAACWVVVTGASIAPPFQRDGGRALRSEVMKNATLSAAEFIMVDSFESGQ